MPLGRLLQRVLLFSAICCWGWLGVVPDLPGQELRADSDKAGVQIQLAGGTSGAARRFVVKGLGDAHLQQLAAAAAKSPAAWLGTLLVTVAADAADKPRPMLGDYAIEGANLVFRPRFPLRQGTTYRVEVFAATDRGKPAIARDFTLPPPAATAPTRLVAIFPSSDLLPENQLKFYLQFSSAMSRGEAYRRLRLLDEDGQQVEFPFLELGEELWDPDGTRFTLFFDPGRIKRGLKPRELFGPALEQGRSYTLVVDQQWQDAAGQALRAGHHKRFKVAAPDDKQPAPRDWEVVPPTAESRQPLVVSFGEPLDHAMLQRVLTVAREGGHNVAGRIVISKQESQWSFQPDDAWAAGKYALVVDAALEDLAGNSIARPFEVDVFDKVDRRPPQAKVRIPFEILP